MAMLAGGGRPLVGAEREAGLRWAREWRARNKPFFDAIYGPDPDKRFCGRCGRPLPGVEGVGD